MEHALEKKRPKLHVYFIVAVSVIILDQLVKWWAYKTLNPLQGGNTIHLVGDDTGGISFNYTLNPGMAFGMSFGGKFGKVMLSLLRLVAGFFIVRFIIRLDKREARKGFILCMAFILAGAMGNLVDSMFYGYIDDSLLVGLPDGKGGELSPPFKLFHGKVIDMIYFNIYNGTIFGYQVNLWPVFNVADSSIFLSVVYLLFNQKKYKEYLSFKKEDKESEDSTSVSEEPKAESTPTKSEATPEQK